MEKAKILILSGDGMAGNMIKTFLEEKGYDVYVTSRKKTDEKKYFFDVLNGYEELERILEKIKPKFVINCIGVLNQFAEENKPGAVLINSFLPHYADSLSNKYGYKFIHISTDCVFSGEKGGYIENDLTDAASFYGKSKALGEVKNDRNVTFRTSIVGPDTNENGIGLFNWFIRQSGEVNGFTKAIWSGVTTLELAKVIEKSFESDVTGLFHLVNNKSINKYDLLVLFKNGMDKNIIINKDESYVNDKSIVNTRGDYDFKIPDYETMVEEMCQWIKNHPDKYNSIISYAKS